MNDPLHQYYELLSAWNRKINLTAIKNEEEFLRKHVEDARALIPHLGSARRLIDLGTGAGLPGIVLKIARPDLEITLLDATRKKISFCSEAIRRLDLKGIRAVWGRAEDEALARAMGRFDLALSRATWPLADFLRVAPLHLGDGGRAIAMKGPKWRAELAAAARELEASPLALEEAHPYELPGAGKRCLIIFQRTL